MEVYYQRYVIDIFKSLIPELEANPSYRFNWAEVGFLKRWWDDQLETDLRERFQALVAKGQIQFVGGGWV
jgi:Glycosyl hydrolases family 38 N-terminal domain